jgi:spore maturation protein CgeB
MKILCVSSPHGFTTRDVWTKTVKGLRAAGHTVETYDLIWRYQAFDFMFTQAERLKKQMPEGWAINTLATEAVFGASFYHKVDAVLIVSPQYFPMTIVDMLRDLGKLTIAYFTECPYEDSIHTPIQAMHFDISLVNDRNSVDLFRQFCPRTYYVAHCYDPDLHYPADGAGYAGISFVGTGYDGRLKFLSAIDWRRFPVPVAIYGQWWHKARKLRPYFQKNQSVDIVANGRTEKNVPSGLINNDVAADIYRRSAVSFNMHRTQMHGDTLSDIDEGLAYSLGPRAFELAACGTFQASDYREELDDLFGDSVPVFKTPAELESILERAVGDPDWRRKMAAWQHEAVRGHDCNTRFAHVSELVAA